MKLDDAKLLKSSARQTEGGVQNGRIQSLEGCSYGIY